MYLFLEPNGLVKLVNDRIKIQHNITEKWNTDKVWQIQQIYRRAQFGSQCDDAYNVFGLYPVVESFRGLSFRRDFPQAHDGVKSGAAPLLTPLCAWGKLCFPDQYRS